MSEKVYEIIDGEGDDMEADREVYDVLIIEAVQIHIKHFKRSSSALVQGKKVRKVY